MKKKLRKITVKNLDYFYSVVEEMEYSEIRIFKQSKIPWIILRLNYLEMWGIPIFTPKAAAIVIEYYQTRKIEDKKTIPFYLQEEKSLFYLLVDTFFKENEKEKKEQFLCNLNRLK